MFSTSIEKSTKPENCYLVFSADASRRIEALLATRVYLYTLFHKLFGGKPNSELIDAICSASTIDALGVFSAESEEFANLRLYSKTLSYSTIQGGFLLRANAEYARLFDHVQPERNAANRSLYGEAGSICGVKAPHVRCLLEQQGMRCVTVHHRQDDHVSFLCAIAAIQAQRALDAFREGDFDAFSMLMDQQAAFNRDHLVSWMPLFATRVCERGTAFLYPQLAKCLAAFVKIDEAFCSDAFQQLSLKESSTIAPAFSLDLFEGSLERIRHIHPLGIEAYEVFAL